MRLDAKLVEATKTFIQSRFQEAAWACAAGMHTEDGDILISTAPEVVTASVCVSRDAKGLFHILTPCGVCQERLMVYGDEVEVAVPSEKDSTVWQARKLKDVQPYYWRKPFMK